KPSASAVPTTSQRNPPPSTPAWARADEHPAWLEAAAELRLGEIRRCLAQDLVGLPQFPYLALQRLHHRRAAGGADTSVHIRAVVACRARPLPFAGQPHVRARGPRHDCSQGSQSRVLLADGTPVPRTDHATASPGLDCHAPWQPHPAYRAPADQDGGDGG